MQKYYYWSVQFISLNSGMNIEAMGMRHPASILYKSSAGRYRPVRVADGPITARCRFIKNAYWAVFKHNDNVLQRKECFAYMFFCCFFFVFFFFLFFCKHFCQVLTCTTLKRNILVSESFCTLGRSMIQNLDPSTIVS